MDDEAERKPDTSGTEDEHDASRTATAEFRVPPKVDLTRPDMAVRRPAKDEPSTPKSTWYVQFPGPASAPAPAGAAAGETSEASAEPAEDEPRPTGRHRSPTPPEQDEGPQAGETEERSEEPPAADEDTSEDTDEPEARGASMAEESQEGPEGEESPGGSAPAAAPPQDRPHDGSPNTRTEPARPASPQHRPRHAAAGEARPDSGTEATQPTPRQSAPPRATRPAPGRSDDPTRTEPAQRPPQAGPRHAGPPREEDVARAAGMPVRERPGNVPDTRAEPSRDASVTRVERLPAVQRSGEHPARSSGQWTVPWDGTQNPAHARPAPPAPPAPPAEPAAKGKGGRRALIVLVAALVLVAGVVAGQLIRPVPEPVIRPAIASSHTFPGQAPALPWPMAGQSAVYVEGLGMMGSSGGAVPTPTASVAKVMTAFVYLREHPLKPGEPGPVLTVSPEAAAQIPMRKKREESLLGVTAYQKLTQRKALEALLIISANDVAHELARWDAGNEQAFVAKMNAAAAELGMTGTRYTDPSGYDSRTVSTAADQVRLLRAAMKIPAFTEIVNNRAYVPDDGGPVRAGGNFLLGQQGVVGGKTGYTDAAGGNFVFAARRNVAGVRTLIIGAVMGQRSPSAAGAVTAAARLVTAAGNALTAATLAPQGAKVARVDDGLGGTTPLRATAPVTVVGWAGLTVAVGVTGDPPHRGAGGQQVGAVTAGAATVPLRLGQNLDEPSYLKRLIRLS